MKMKAWITRIAVAAAAAAAIPAAVALHADDYSSRPPQQPSSAPNPGKEKGEPTAPASAEALIYGDTKTARWTETTWEAASAEAHKKVLSSGKVATVKGELVEVSCYLQLGKRGEAHIPCGIKCAMNGQPLGVVDDDGKLYLLMAEEHHPRRDGEVDLKKVFLPSLAKTVTVTGMMTDAGGYRALFVQAKEIGAGKKTVDGKVPMQQSGEKK